MELCMHLLADARACLLTLQVACCDMIPPFPDFPTEWRATVEANIINQGYTYVQRETYSEAHVRLMAAAGCNCDDAALTSSHVR